jgi:hypothetical protein
MLESQVRASEQLAEKPEPSEVAIKFARLTRNHVRALQPGEHLTEHGIVVERQRNGDLRYSVNIMVDGRRIHRVIGRESEGMDRPREGRCASPAHNAGTAGRLEKAS